jgi:hypothetical protein
LEMGRERLSLRPMERKKQNCKNEKPKTGFI